MFINQGGSSHGFCPSCGYCPNCGQRRQSGIGQAWGAAGQYPQGINGNQWEKKYQELAQKQGMTGQTGSPHQEKPENA